MVSSEANEWFEGLDNEYKENIIETVYNLLGSIKDGSKIKELTKNHGSELNKLKDKYDDSLIESIKINKILNEFKYDMSHEIKNLTMSSQKIGKMAELSIISLLVDKFPSALVEDVSNDKGGGDIKVNINGINIMIESKSRSDSSLSRKPELIKNFEVDLCNSSCDYGIFVALRAKTIPSRGVISFNDVNCDNGIKIAAYIADVNNHPDRLITVVRILELLDYNKYNNNEKDIGRLLFQTEKLIRL